MERHSQESLDVSPNEIDPAKVLSALTPGQRYNIQRAVMIEMMGEMEGAEPTERLTAWAMKYGALFDKALLKYAEQEHISLEELADTTKHPGEITAITENLRFLIERSDKEPPTYH